MSLLCSKTFNDSLCPTVTQPVVEGTLGQETAGWVLEELWATMEPSGCLILAQPEIPCLTWDPFLDLPSLTRYGVESEGLDVVNSKYPFSSYF